VDEGASAGAHGRGSRGAGARPLLRRKICRPLRRVANGWKVAVAWKRRQSAAARDRPKRGTPHQPASRRPHEGSWARRRDSVGHQPPRSVRRQGSAGAVVRPHGSCPRSALRSSPSVVAATGKRGQREDKGAHWSAREPLCRTFTLGRTGERRPNAPGTVGAHTSAVGLPKKGTNAQDPRGRGAVGRPTVTPLLPKSPLVQIEA